MKVKRCRLWVEYSRLYHKRLHHIGPCGLCSYIAAMFLLLLKSIGWHVCHLDHSICSYVNTVFLLKFHSATLTVKVISGLQLPVTWANHIQVKAVIIVNWWKPPQYSEASCNYKIIIHRLRSKYMRKQMVVFNAATKSNNPAMVPHSKTF